MRPGGIGMRRFIALLAFWVATAAVADGVTTYVTEDSFDDAVFALESAIVEHGLVIENTSHVGRMLRRTGEDVGSARKIFDNATVFSFCSAVVSRKVMEADPMNIAYCPYTLFVAEREGVVTIGFRNYPAGPMQAVQGLLDGIVREAAGR